MSEHVYFLSIFVPLAAILAIFGMKYYAAIASARARLAGDEAYRKLAEQCALGQSETATRLAAIESATAQIGQRLASVEAILKDVG
ncbi:hypothetical protein QH494_16415 [Sphingomonas sp. AR_OL41]|jgi:Mg2+ and Co2+ transporter CorA|uniref:hypothetical protein n=1 Tax=Sphingomonas sp. AR_OL41 TaxID=3042729 RepID=UPI002480E95C|nr:hypothetical protein [Sphingomonas sp. AR_OL41]MDH7973776.1 hypothetical protein [Sphingomonas sp. AR_OL41]